MGLEPTIRPTTECEIKENGNWIKVTVAEALEIQGQKRCIANVRACGGNCLTAVRWIGAGGRRSRPEGPIQRMSLGLGGHRIERLRWSCEASPEPERTR